MMKKVFLYRRHILPFLVCLFFAFPSISGPSERAENQVQRLLSDIIRVASSQKPEDQRNVEVRRIIEQNCDVTTIARDVLGHQKWDRASPEERRAFTDAFIAYFSRKVGRELSSLRGSKLRVSGAKKVDAYYEVSSSMQKGRNRRNIKWRLQDQGGQFRFVNLYVGGFSATSHEAGNVRDIMEMHHGNIRRTARTLLNRAGLLHRTTQPNEHEEDRTSR